MKNNHITNHIAVWLDHHTAQFYTYKPEHAEEGFKLTDKLEESDLHKFYQQVSKRLVDFDEVLLFGPGKAQEELRNHLLTDKHFQNKRIDVKTENHLTENQRAALVRNHFATVLR